MKGKRKINVDYRLIEKKDNSELLDLVQRVFFEFNAHIHKGTAYYDKSTSNLFELFQNPNAECWVSLFQGKIVGSCGVYPTKGLPSGYVELVKFYVDLEFREFGVGKDLFLNCLKSARRLGYSNVYLESLPEFTKAVKFYEDFGFHHLGEPLGDSGHYGCSIWMEKELESTHIFT